MEKITRDLFINENKLFELVFDCFKSAGMDANDAEISANLLIKTDKWGIHTHGLKNLAGYIAKAKVGGVSFTNKPEIIKEFPSIALVDAHNTFGFVSGTFGMNKAIDMADKTGIGMVVVKNSSHFGAGSCYGNIAAEKGFIGIAMSNVDKKMSIPGTIGMTMGHNPFCLCVPASIIPSVCLDSSSSNTSSLRVLGAKAKGEKIPFGWITDKDGLPTDDPSHYPEEGALLPLGNYKGYGIAFFIDVMTGVLASSLNSVSDDIPSWCFDLEKPNMVSHTFIAINAKLLASDYIEQVDKMIKDAKNNKKAKGVSEITVPGEDMWKRFKDAEQKKEVYLPKDVVDELVKVIDYDKLFGEK